MHPDIGMLCHVVLPFLIFQCTSVVFSIMDVQIYISSSIQGFYICHTLTNICYSFSGFFFVFIFVILFIILGNNKHEMIALRDGDLSFCGDKWWRSPFALPVGCVHNSSEKWPFRPVLVSFPVSMIKHWKNSTQGRKEDILVHSSRYSPLWQGSQSRQWELEAAGHMTSTVKKQRALATWAQLAFSILCSSGSLPRDP